MYPKVLLYTGIFHSDKDGPVVWITIDGKAFVGCPNRCVEPLQFTKPDKVICPRCDWQTTTEAVRGVLANILGHAVALYAMIGECDPVENIRATYMGITEETDNVAPSDSNP